MVNKPSSILCEVCERPRLATRPPVTPSHPPINPPRPPAPVLGMPGDPDSQVSKVCMCVNVSVSRVVQNQTVCLLLIQPADWQVGGLL